MTHILAAPLTRQKCVFHNILEFRRYRIGNRLQNPPHSALRIHSLDKKHYLTNDNFKILDTANNESDLRILESLYIFKNRPKLNMDSIVLLRCRWSTSNFSVYFTFF